MRKKWVVTLLVAGMMGSMLAGCGGGSETSGEEGKESSQKGDTIKVMCVGTEADTYLDAYNSIAENFLKIMSMEWMWKSSFMKMSSTKQN